MIVPFRDEEVPAASMELEPFPAGDGVSNHRRDSQDRKMVQAIILVVCKTKHLHMILDEIPQVQMVV